MLNQHDGSTIQAGGIAAFVAQGNGTPGGGNLTIVGSDVNAQNVAIASGGDTNLLGASISAGSAEAMNRLAGAIADADPTGNADMNKALGNIVASSLAGAVGAVVGGNSGAFAAANVDRYNRQLEPEDWMRALIFLSGFAVMATGGISSRAHMLKIKPFDNSYKKARESYKAGNGKEGKKR